MSELLTPADWRGGTLSDRQIRAMAAQGMIEPFEEKQIAAGRVSSGVSSYGYDARAGNEFKIFTNVHSTIVDPKNFDDRSFVTQTSDDFVTMPPHSFLLTSTVEWFRIPRDVLVFCLGKSTYARCFTGDTKVLVVEADRLVAKRFDSLADDRKVHWGLSLDTAGKLHMTQLLKPRKTGTQAVVEVEFTDGTKLRCTPDHQFYHTPRERHPISSLRDGSVVSYAQLKDQPGVYLHRQDKVVREIREIPGTRDVYCLTAPEHGNFLLADGQVVKNCGLVVNVTPLEPGWEGHVTIEVSNTTPLPAKVYANEGICQFIFLKGSEACETSYADRRGKYMHQRGVTLPRILTR